MEIVLFQLFKQTNFHNLFHNANLSLTISHFHFTIQKHRSLSLSHENSSFSDFESNDIKMNLPFNCIETSRLI